MTISDSGITGGGAIGTISINGEMTGRNFGLNAMGSPSQNASDASLGRVSKSGMGVLTALSVTIQDGTSHAMVFATE